MDSLAKHLSFGHGGEVSVPKPSPRRKSNLQADYLEVAPVPWVSVAQWLRLRGKCVRPKLTEQQKLEMKEAFGLMDLDGSGAIDVDELEDALKLLGIRMSRHEVEELMKEVDKDGTGELEFAEFLEVMTETLQRLSEQEDKGGESSVRLPFSLMSTAYRRKRYLETVLNDDQEGLQAMVNVAESGTRPWIAQEEETQEHQGSHALGGGAHTARPKKWATVNKPALFSSLAALPLDESLLRELSPRESQVVATVAAARIAVTGQPVGGSNTRSGPGTPRAVASKEAAVHARCLSAHRWGQQQQTHYQGQLQSQPHRTSGSLSARPAGRYSSTNQCSTAAVQGAQTPGRYTAGTLSSAAAVPGRASVPALSRTSFTNSGYGTTSRPGSSPNPVFSKRAASAVGGRLKSRPASSSASSQFRSRPSTSQGRLSSRASPPPTQLSHFQSQGSHGPAWSPQSSGSNQLYEVAESEGDSGHNSAVAPAAGHSSGTIAAVTPADATAPGMAHNPAPGDGSLSARQRGGSFLSAYLSAVASTTALATMHGLDSAEAAAAMAIANMFESEILTHPVHTSNPIGHTFDNDPRMGVPGVPAAMSAPNSARSALGAYAALAPSAVASARTAFATDVASTLTARGLPPHLVPAAQPPFQILNRLSAPELLATTTGAASPRSSGRPAPGASGGATQGGMPVGGSIPSYVAVTPCGSTTTTSASARRASVASPERPLPTFTSATPMAALTPAALHPDVVGPGFWTSRHHHTGGSTTRSVMGDASVPKALAQPLLFSKPAFPMPGGSRPVTARAVTTRTGITTAAATPGRQPRSKPAGSSSNQQEDWRAGVYYALPDAKQDAQHAQSQQHSQSGANLEQGQGSQPVKDTARRQDGSESAAPQTKADMPRPIVPPLKLNLLHKGEAQESSSPQQPEGAATSEQVGSPGGAASESSPSEAAFPLAAATPAPPHPPSSAHRTDPAAYMRAAGQAAVHRFSRYNTGATLHVLAAVPTAQGRGLQPAAQAAEAAAAVAECTRGRKEQEAEDRITYLVAQQAALLQASAQGQGSPAQGNSPTPSSGAANATAGTAALPATSPHTSQPTPSGSPTTLGSPATASSSGRSSSARRQQQQQQQRSSSLVRAAGGSGDLASQVSGSYSGNLGLSVQGVLGSGLSGGGSGSMVASYSGNLGPPPASGLSGGVVARVEGTSYTCSPAYSPRDPLHAALSRRAAQIVVRNETLRHSVSSVMTAAQQAEQILATAAAGAEATHNTTQIPEEEEGAEGDGTALTVPFEDGTTTPGNVPSGDLDLTLSAVPSQSVDVQEGPGMGVRPHGVMGLQGALSPRHDVRGHAAAERLRTYTITPAVMAQGALHVRSLHSASGPGATGVLPAAVVKA